MKAIHRLLLLMASLALLAPGSAALAAMEQPKVLVYSGTTGYRHASIEAGVAAIKALGAREKLTIVATEDPTVFSTEGLKGFDAIIFLSATTDPKKPESEWLVGERRNALQAFVRDGGGIVGIHAAADSHYHWPWFGRMMGGYFTSHPKGTPEGALRVVDSRHPSTRGLSTNVRRVDEWYYFGDYDPEAQLLITLDPASIGEKDVNPNPISWAKPFEGGRVFYTAMGHTAESFAEPYFLKHFTGGLRWAITGR